MRYSPKQYAEALYDLIKESPHQKSKIIKEFAESLHLNNDLKHADEIYRQFEKIADEKEGIIRGDIHSAKAEVHHLPHEFNGLKLKTEIHKDPKTLGGIKIKIGDTLVDNTISHRLKQLKTVIG
jgi:F0F1-type ATP synthase delta subunit